jgi:hypothetical protein
MLRIVGVQRSELAEREFVLLQNQGTLRALLRGHVVVSDGAISRGDLCRAAHVFMDDESIPAGLYVLLTTGRGTPHWSRTKDGAHVFHAYAGRDVPLWPQGEGAIHLLNPCHSFVERGEALLLR